MPAETITLTQDQAEDLRELLSYAEILEDWLRCPEASGQSIQ
jgi:hypothetical protein